MTKTTRNLKTTPGDLLKIKCKVHGAWILIAGIDFAAGTPMPDPKEFPCERCRTVPVGKRQVGTGYVDSKGVPYVVDIHGNLRHVDKLKDHQTERIMGRKKLLRGGKR